MNCPDISTKPGAVNRMPGLPPTNTVRWCARRKAQVALAIVKGALPLDEAMAMYSLSAEELNNWLELYKTHGIRGLRATRCQDYRVAA